MTDAGPDDPRAEYLRGRVHGFIAGLLVTLFVVGLVLGFAVA